MHDSVHASTGEKLCVLMYGESPCTQLDWFIEAAHGEKLVNPPAFEVVCTWKRHLRAAQELTRVKQADIFAQFNMTKRAPVPFIIGQTVMLSAKAITSPGDRGTKWKLRDQWYGPLTVIDVKQDDYGHLSTVRLQLPHQWRAHDWFSMDEIKEYNHSQATKWPLRAKPPVPDVVLVEGYEEHVVEQILSHRPATCKKGKPQMEWLVCWHGMGPVEDQWCNHDHINTGGECGPWRDYERARMAENMML